MPHGCALTPPRCAPSLTPTGLWADISLRLSACGAFYLSCTPETVKRHVEEEPEAKAARAEVEAEAEAEAEAEPPQPEPVAAGEAEPQLEPAEPSGEGAGEGEEEDWQAPGLDAEVEAAMAATAAAEAAETIRVRTLAVPMSVANSAPTPSRLHQLLALSDAEGAPVSLALVASDGTVIVSHIYRGMKPPDVLDADEDADDF